MINTIFMSLYYSLVMLITFYTIILRNLSEPTIASDMYSFGMVLYSLLYRQTPHAGKSIGAIRRSSLHPLTSGSDTNSNSGESLTLQLPRLLHINPELLELVEKCCLMDPTARPSFDVVYGRLEELSII